MSRRSPLSGVLSLAGSGLLLSLWVAGACSSEDPDKKAQAATVDVDVDSTRYRVGTFADDLALGGDAPLVTIVVFTDYACPPCGRTWQVMDHVVEDYGDDVRVVLRSFTVPGFARGEQAAEAAFAAAAQDKFWPMHRRLFDHPSRFDRPSLRAHAEALGLDVERFLDDLDTGAEAGRRIRHRRQAKELGVLGLPATFVNGRFVAGFHDEKFWHALVDEEIAASKQQLAAGVPRAELYATLMKEASTARVQLHPDHDDLADDLAAKQPASYPKDLRRPDPAARYDIDLEGSPSIGPDDAPVVLVEFVDFRCPYCRKVWSEELQTLLTEHADDVRLVVKQLPLPIHPEAQGCAVATLAAHAQGKFDAFARKLYAHEDPVGRSHFVKWASELGLDEAKFLAALDDPALAQQVSRDMRVAAALGVTGTPAVFVNGRHLGGYHPGALPKLVDEELQRAEAAMKEGTPRAGLARALLGVTAAGPDAYPNRQLLGAGGE